MELIHTCYRITEPDRSVAFYEALGFEKRRGLPIRDEAVNYFLGVPGRDGPELELTYNFETPEGGYELGTGYGHIAVTVDDLDSTLERVAGKGDRAGAASVHRSRGRLADLFRPRPGRLSDRVSRARLKSGLTS